MLEQHWERRGDGALGVENKAAFLTRSSVAQAPAWGHGAVVATGVWDSGSRWHCGRCQALSVCPWAGGGPRACLPPSLRWLGLLGP